MPAGSNSAKPKILTARRVTLMASVAALGFAVLIGGPGYRALDIPAWASAAHADYTAPAPQGFADLVEKVKPAVISVRVKIEEANNDGNVVAPNQIPPGMEKFFKQFGFPDMPNGVPRGMPHGRQMITGLGSGFFISADGYAVTNNHVVDHAKTVQIKTDDGATYTAKVVGTDPKTDLALIKVDAKKTFPYVKFAEHAPRVGDWVVAVGNPFGLGGTVTAGIVSASGRDIGAGPYDDYIQIDAPINKGNSGGPAFNSNGNVIGVNTAIFSPSGGSVGIGFDIPAETVKTVVAQLKEHGYVNRAYMGVQVQAVTSSIADSLGLKKAEGALVDKAEPASPAAKAGIKAGDVITAVNGKTVKDSRDLARKIGAMTPGSDIKLTYLHDGAVKELSMTLTKMPGEQHEAKAQTKNGSKSGVPHLGLAVAPAKEVAGAGDEGVAVLNVDPDGPAAERGVKTGDVILSVGGKSVASAADVQQALKDAKAKGHHDVLVRVKTANAATRFIALPIGHA
jgi:serine protease Do